MDLLYSSKILETDNPIRWDATSLAAQLYAQFYDFEHAEHLIELALAHNDTAWTWHDRALIYELEDRYQDALTAARRAFDLNPQSPATSICVAHLLALIERDNEAIDTLRTLLTTIESPRMAAYLADLEIEHGQHGRALETLDLFDRLTVIKDKGTISWLAGRRSDVYSLLGDVPSALAHARVAKTPFYKEIASNLEQAGAESHRVMLPVGFVRQHHMTCAPATLSAVSRYWNMAADHLDLAEAICYDGTPHHSERQWATTHGWHTREFTVTWESARALIDTGTPFTLTTADPGGSHLQAVIGYDASRRVLLIRDPYARVYGEFAAASFFESYASTGPRGMVFIPNDLRDRLETIILPDAALYDLLHDIQHALSVHDRDRAAARCDELVHSAPGHRITLNAQRTLANYDGDQEELLRIIEQLIALYPRDVMLRLVKVNLLRELADQSTYFKYLEDQATAPSAHAYFKLRYAQALLDDGRRHHEAFQILKKTSRIWNTPETLSALADANWYAGQHRQAVDLYRLAATLANTDEGHAYAYFRASRLVRAEEEAIGYLRHRAARYERRSSRPAITLYDCLSELNRTDEACETRDHALALRPEDGELLLFAARSASELGQQEEATSLLQRARDRCKWTDWLRTAAHIQEREGHLEEARRLWQDVAELEPLNLDAHRAIVRLTTEINERSDAIQYLRQLARRFPHHQGINELFAEWLNEAALEEQDRAVRQLLLISPTNAWAHRQLAVILAKQGRFDEARAESTLAQELVPHAVSCYTTHGFIELRAGRLMEARAAFRAALRCSVDSDYALTNLLDACQTLDERREALTFILDEMKRQVIIGDSLLSFQRSACGTLEANELKSILDEARQIRPDIWQTWAACARQCIEMQQYETARMVCVQAIAKFPLIPRLHIELAETARLLGDRQAERAALQEALRINPTWGYAARQLAESWEAAGDFQMSRAVLEEAIRRSPSDALLHGYLGATLWQLDECTDAMRHLEQAVRLDVWYEWAWNRLKEHGPSLTQPEAAVALARTLAIQRPGEPGTWLAVARMADHAEEKLAAVERTLALAPLTIDAHHLKLDLLIQAHRFDEALIALRTTAWGATPPTALRIKKSKILAEQGQKEEAIIQLQALLTEDPQYVPGWRQLADWQDQQDNYAGYLTAVRQWHSLEPDNAYALGYLADALAKAEDETDVRPHLRRALELQPDYVFAGHWLFDLEMHTGALDAAERVLGVLKVHANTMATRLREVRLTIQRKSRTLAVNLVRDMLIEKGNEDIETVREAVTALDEAGWGRDLTKMINALAIDSRANPLVGTLWVERRAEPWLAWNRFRGYEDVLANSPVKDYAAQALIKEYGKPDRVKALHHLRNQYGSEWATHENLFPALASAFMGAMDPWAAIKWIGKNWEERSELSAQVLLTLACALRYDGRPQDAHDIHEAALARLEDYSFPMHRIWLKLDGACHGDYTKVDLAREKTWHSPIQYVYGNGEYQSMIDRYLPAAQQGDEEARKFIVSMYQYGYGPDSAAAQVLPWYAASIEGDRAYNEKRYNDALRSFEQAALNGNVTALQRLGNMYWKGRGVASDWITAYLLCLEAMRYGHIIAKGQVAWMLLGGLQAKEGMKTGLALKKEHRLECKKIKTVFLNL
ncbi:MAG: C39 family peptidase [Nitrospiraceae bacterium]|nr:C39 family peptidase [Nitrospiraceae bacterium]